MLFMEYIRTAVVYVDQKFIWYGVCLFGSFNGYNYLINSPDAIVAMLFNSPNTYCLSINFRRREEAQRLLGESLVIIDGSQQVMTPM